MSEKIWKWLAAFIVRHPAIVAWIIRNAQRKPYFHLDGYMERWWLTPKFLLTINEYGESYPYEWVPMMLRVRLHHILRADNERHLHDHPADNRSIILKNAYREIDIFGEGHFRRAGDTVSRRAEFFHRIEAVSQGGVWTLFFLGKKRNRWGFLVDGGKIYWSDYLRDQNG